MWNLSWVCANNISYNNLLGIDAKNRKWQCKSYHTYSFHFNFDCVHPSSHAFSELVSWYVGFTLLKQPYDGRTSVTFYLSFIHRKTINQIFTSYNSHGKYIAQLLLLALDRDIEEAGWRNLPAVGLICSYHTISYHRVSQPSICQTRSVGLPISHPYPMQHHPRRIHQIHRRRFLPIAYVITSDQWFKL